MPLRRALVFTALFSLAAAVAYSQTTAGIVGSVRDQSGSIMPNVTVTITDTNTNVSRSVTSDAAGDYVATNLGVGEYQISAESPGFKRFVRKPVTLEVSQTARVDIALQPGEVTETITVSGTAPLIESERSSIGNVIDNKTIVDLPLNGRNFIRLGSLAPGTTRGAPGNGTVASRQGGEVLTVNGQRAGYNNYLLDGIDNNETNLGLAVIIPSVDAIQEFRLQTANYSAEFGRAAGAVVNLATRSGGNSVHGAAYEFLRNDVLDARNTFAPSKNPLRQNQFGVSIGGPVVLPSWNFKRPLYDGRNRTFFFANYEGLRLRQGFTSGSVVPTGAQRAGDFSGSATLYDPLRLDAAGARLPFPQNKIPASRINPVSARILGVYPLPNSNDPARNYIQGLSAPTDGDQWTLRMDHTITTQDQIMLRLSRPNSDIGSPSITYNGTVTQNRPRGGAIAYTRIFSPTIVNDFRFGAQRYEFNLLPEGLGTDFPSQLGLPTFGASASDLHYPAINISNINSPGSAGASLPVLRAENTFQWIDSFSLILGRHSLKFGGDLRIFQFNNSQPQAVSGAYTFSGAFTGRIGSQYANGFGDFLLGLPAQQQILNETGYSPSYIRNKRLNLFIQDDFQVTRKLTLNYGLRWERDGSWTEKYDRWAYFDFTSGQTVYPKTAQIGFTSFPYPFRFDDIRSLKKPSNLAFAPRFGFAFRPFADGTTVIRAAYGVFQGQPTLNPLNNAALTPPPYLLRQTVTSGSTTPSLTFGVFPGTSASSLLPMNPSFFTLNPNSYRNGYVQQWNFGIERELPLAIALKTSYVGSKGTHLDMRSEGNPAWPPGPGAVQTRRLYPRFGSITNSTSNGFSTYHALQVSAERRFSRGFEFLAGYTYSKSLDLVSEWGGLSNENFLPQNPFNWSQDKGRSSTDLRQRFTLSAIYQTPRVSTNSLLNGVIGNWQLSGLLTLQTGFPFTVLVPGDIPNIGQSTASERANLSGNPRVSSPSPDRWFNTAAFSLPAAYTFGNAGRNILDGPGLRSLDFSLMKLIPITEGQRLQFRAEFFNFPNHPNYGLPNASVGNTAIGTIRSADARVIQFGLKYLF